MANEKEAKTVPAHAPSLAERDPKMEPGRPRIGPGGAEGGPRRNRKGQDNPAWIRNDRSEAQNRPGRGPREVKRACKRVETRLNRVKRRLDKPRQVKELKN